jgi:hypothetical protein
MGKILGTVAGVALLLAADLEARGQCVTIYDQRGPIGLRRSTIILVQWPQYQQPVPLQYGQPQFSPQYGGQYVNGGSFGDPRFGGGFPGQYQGPSVQEFRRPLTTDQFGRV